MYKSLKTLLVLTLSLFSCTALHAQLSKKVYRLSEFGIKPCKSSAKSGQLKL